MVGNASSKALILTPLADEAEVLAGIARDAGLSPYSVTDGDAFRAALEQRPLLSVTITEEGAGSETGKALQRLFDSEPSWSRVPVTFLIGDPASPPPAVQSLTRDGAHPPARLIGRPARPALLAAFFRTDADLRRRQFKTRDLLEELEQAKARQSFLLNELRHRTRNSLSVLQSLFLLTARKKPDKEALVEAFTKRIQAMVAAYEGLAAQSQNGSRSLAALASEQVEPCVTSANQIELAGENVILGERTAFDLALILHELATNAVKYGALKRRDGRVLIAWHRDDRGDLAIRWTERGGPEVVEPDRAGLGMELISRMSIGAAGARGQVDFAAEGLRWRTTIPAAEIEPPGQVGGF